MCYIRDVANLQFNRSTVLPESFLHDSIMCGLVADVDWDGINEIILGTYGKRLLIYKCRTTGSGVDIPYGRNFQSFIFKNGQAFLKIFFLKLLGIHYYFDH